MRWRRAAETSYLTGREIMGPPILQTLQDPILLLSWLCFRGGGFPNPLRWRHDEGHAAAGVLMMATLCCLGQAPNAGQ
jgi:hypothetical protein